MSVLQAFFFSFPTDRPVLYNKFRILSGEDMTDEMNKVISETEAEPKTSEKKQRQGMAVYAAVRIVRRNFWNFFAFEIIYKLITFGLVIPLIRRITAQILKFNGITSLTDANFLKMLSQPATWIGALLVILLSGLVISIEFAALFGGIHAAEEGKKISVHEMFMNGLAHCDTVFHIKNWMYLVFVIIVIPLAGLAEGGSLIQSLTIPGFILEWLNEKWYLELAYTIGMLALMYLVLRWIYVLPSMAIRQRSFSDACRESSRMMHHHILPGLLAVIICYLWLFALVTLIGLGICGGSFLIIHWLDPSVNLENCIMPVIIASMITGYVLLLLMSSPLIFSRVYVGYKRQVEKNGEEVPAYERPDTWFTRNKIFKTALSACLLLGIYFFIPGRYQEVKLVLNNASNQAMVMAHRGDSVNAPENTLPAFQAAIDDGADAAEMDVQMTKDGTIVVLHDASIDRTSTGHGNIWDVTYDEIKDLDNGSFFDEKFADTRIPTLDQVIKLCKGKLYLNIEIKRTGHDDGIEQKVLDVIKDNNFQEQCDITSMDYNTLVNVRSLDPTIKTVYTTTVAIGDVADLSAADAFSVETTFVNQTFVRQMRQNGKELFVWTVNDESEMKRMLALGANAIITNDPVQCRQVVEESKNGGAFGIMERLNTSILGG